MKDECPYELSANAELCPLQIPTFLPPEADMDRLKDFFAASVEMDLERIYNISIGQIVTMLDEPKFQNGTFVEKWNSVVDLFAQGLLEKREEMLAPDA